MTFELKMIEKKFHLKYDIPGRVSARCGQKQKSY
jgi:hypothetical protein